MSTIHHRRDFLKTIGLGAAALTMPFAGKSASSRQAGIQNHSSNEPLTNGFDFELIFARDYFLGIGNVKTNGVLLRSNKLPMSAQVTTPEAIELVNFKLINKTESADGIILDFSVKKQLGNTMEWMLHTVRNRRNMTDWTIDPEEAPDTKFKMIIKPVGRKIGNKPVRGLSYQYIFESRSLSIYKITPPP